MAFNPLVPYTSAPLVRVSGAATASSTAALPIQIQTFASQTDMRHSFKQLLPTNLWPAMGQTDTTGSSSFLQRYLTTSFVQTTTWLWNTLGFPNVNLSYLQDAMAADYEALRILFHTFASGANPEVELHERLRVYLRRSVIRF